LDTFLLTVPSQFKAKSAPWWSRCEHRRCESHSSRLLSGEAARTSPGHITPHCHRQASRIKAWPLTGRKLLSQDDDTIQEENQPPQSPRLETKFGGGARLCDALPSLPPHSVLPNPPNGDEHSAYGTYESGRSQAPQEWAGADADDASSSRDAPADGYDSQVQNEQPAARPQFDRQCTRTVQLLNLPEGATHGDITAVVRGGLLLDIFLRTHDRSATVSFLRAIEARAFFDHVKRHDLYIKNKRVEVRWNDRQFILPGHVANKIGIGASRNIAIRRYDPRLTEETIREDLEHIHNLVVIKVSFLGGSCYISTNSVHNAIFARTCMMSRLRYKGSRIGWDVDECAQPFDPIPVARLKKEAQPSRKLPTAMANRFHLLNLDDEDEGDEIASAFQRAKNPVGVAT